MKYWPQKSAVTWVKTYLIHEAAPKCLTISYPSEELVDKSETVLKFKELRLSDLDAELEKKQDKTN